MSEYRGLIVAGTLLASFAILSLAIPAQLYTADSMHQLTVPAYFSLDELYYFSNDDLVNLIGNLSGTGYPEGTYVQIELDDGSGDFGGWDIDLFYRLAEDPNLQFFVAHMHTEWWGLQGADHAMSMENTNGVDRGSEISIDELENDMSSGNARYNAICDHTRLTCVVAYNTTLYASAEDAWDNEGLSIYFGIQFDNENTGFNAMNLIASILFFDMPNVHWTINTLIAVPLWIAIGYISLILILRAIDALPFT